MRSLAVIAIFMLFVGGGASAAQTSLDLTVSGNAFVGDTYKLATHSGLPYELESYSMATVLIGVHKADYTHSLDTTDSVEAETSLVASESNGGAMVMVDENVHRTVIGDSVALDNNATYSRCYSAGAGYNTQAQYLDFKSATLVTDTDLAYAVESSGLGSMCFVSDEYVAAGDIGVNGTWMSSYAKDNVRAKGIFDFTANYNSDNSDYPAAFEEEEDEKGLCPFGANMENGWD